jgi:phospholipid transport system substrate-binding protein
MRRTLPVLALLFALVVSHGASTQTAEGTQPATAAATVTRLQEGLIALMQSSDGAASAADTVTELLRATHDMQYIARVVLGRHWRELSAEEQAKFIEQFEALSVANYTARFRNYGGERFEVADEQIVSDDEHNVRSMLTTAKGETHEFVYTLRRDAETWRIVNIVVDGVSDLALKRAEYGRLMDSGGFEGLLAELSRQTERLRARGDEAP